MTGSRSAKLTSILLLVAVASAGAGHAAPPPPGAGYPTDASLTCAQVDAEAARMDAVVSAAQTAIANGRSQQRQVEAGAGLARGLGLGGLGSAATSIARNSAAAGRVKQEDTIRTARERKSVLARLRGRACAPAPAASTPVAARTLPAQTAALATTPGRYLSAQFDGVTNWVGLLDKGCNDPADFNRIKAQMQSTANGAGAAVNRLGRPGRNDYEKMGSDLQVQEAYYPNACQRVEQARQCLQAREYSAEEACDCLAGFPGDARIGVGAGELVVSANWRRGVETCSAAAQRATGADKARYTAQLARAQTFSNDLFQARKNFDAAASAGYSRANSGAAFLAIRDVEFGTSGFPGYPVSQVQDIFGIAADYLRKARLAGHRDTPAIAKAADQVAASIKFNMSVIAAWGELQRPVPGNAGLLQACLSRAAGHAEADDCRRRNPAR